MGRNDPILPDHVFEIRCSDGLVMFVGQLGPGDCLSEELEALSAAALASRHGDCHGGRLPDLGTSYRRRSCMPTSKGLHVTGLAPGPCMTLAVTGGDLSKSGAASPAIMAACSTSIYNRKASAPING
ncbi:unnamed protein product, partial [Protopolystoma xenopodis]